MGGGKFGMSALDPLVWYDGGDVEDSEAVTEACAVSESASDIVPVPSDRTEGVLRRCQGMWLYY